MGVVMSIRTVFHHLKAEGKNIKTADTWNNNNFERRCFQKALQINGSIYLKRFASIYDLPLKTSQLVNSKEKKARRKIAMKSSLLK